MYNYLVNLSYRDKNDTVYRKELLECFYMTEYTDEINNKIRDLYTTVEKYYKDITHIIKNKNSSTFFASLDEPACFTILFSWEYFHEHHQLLVEIYNKTDKIGEKKKILIDKINHRNK